MEAYNINGNNYFKLRDLAMIVSGTDKQFDVAWGFSPAFNKYITGINLTKGSAYTVVGGEMKAPTTTSQNAKESDARIYINLL